VRCIPALGRELFKTHLTRSPFDRLGARTLSPHSLSLAGGEGSGALPQRRLEALGRERKVADAGA
jgi:hypothetical protein